MADQFLQKPESGLHCEAKGCMKPAVGIYGPECERETGQLMYVCENHFVSIQLWAGMNADEPVECPTHGRLGKVKDYLVLRRM